VRENQQIASHSRIRKAAASPTFGHRTSSVCDNCGLVADALSVESGKANAEVKRQACDVNIGNAVLLEHFVQFGLCFLVVIKERRIGIHALMRPLLHDLTQMHMHIHAYGVFVDTH